MATDTEVKRICETLKGEGIKDCDKTRTCYVYMLLDEKKVPFYIGKGSEGRVFQHENDADRLLKLIKEDRDDAEGKYAALSEKIKTIFKNKGEIEKVIVKWGLSEEEAFMCESALINLYDYINPRILKNIQNGHASDLEKASKHADGCATKARSDKDFVKNVAIEEECFQDYCKDIPVVFITPKTSYDIINEEKKETDFSDDEYCYDAARGFWKLDKKKAEKARFVIVLNQQIVKGVYPVSPDRWFTLVEYPLEDFPKFPKYFRVGDLAAAGKDKTYQEYLSMGGTDTEENFNKLRKWIGFVKSDNYDKSEYKLLSGLVGKLLTDNFVKQQKGTYNFKVDSKGNLRFYDSVTWKK